MAWPASRRELEDRIEELQIMNKHGMLRPNDIERNELLIDAYKKQLKELDSDGR